MTDDVTPLQIEPHIRVGPIRFGMTRSEARRLLGEYEEFRKSSDSKATTDAFDEVGLHVYYREDGIDEVDAVEIMSRANPSFRGELLAERPFVEIVALFRKADPEVEVDSNGLDAPNLNISIFAPKDCLAEEGEDPRFVQGVYVSTPGRAERARAK